MTNVLCEVEKSPVDVCALQVCPDNHRFNRRNLRAIMSGVILNEDQCHVRVFDTLGRYSLMSRGVSEEEAFLQSKKRGDEWIKRYTRYQKRDEYKNNFSCEIMRWSDIVSLTEFQEKFDLAWWAYKNTKLKTVVDDYVERHVIQVIDDGREYISLRLLEECSRNYIIEEISGKSALVYSIDAHSPFEVYSGHNYLDPLIFERISKAHGIDLRIHSYLGIKFINNEDGAASLKIKAA